MTTTRECLESADLEQLALGSASAELRARAEAHLDRCQECARMVAELARLFGSAAPAVGPSASPSWAYHATLPVRPPSLPPPSVGRYQLGARLGEGGMGVVYAAHDPELDRPVAIKVLHPDPDADPEQLRARLLGEAQAMARLNHPNVVAVYDVGTVDAQVFVAVELVDGVTLRGFLEAPRSLAELLRVFSDAGRGLAAAHDRGLVHRDFKPDNVLVGEDGRARVTDFGLARRVDLRPADDPTSTFALAGTPAYMAPEQFRGEPTDARTDQFAFAVALYEAALSRRPFEGATLGELARSVVGGKLRPPGAPAPRWLRAVLLRALAHRREDRFPSMHALLAELGRDRGRPVRTAMVFGLVLSATAGLVTVGRAFLTPPRTHVLPVASASTSDPCAGDSAFGPDERTSLSKILTKLHPEMSARFVDELGAFADALGKARQAACKAPPSAAIVACLDDRTRTLEAYVGGARRTNVYGLAIAVERLDLPWIACDPTFPLAAADAGPAFVRTRDRLAAARVAVTFGLEDDAERALDDVLAASPEPLSLAEANLLLGLHRQHRFAYIGATEAFGKALGVARDAKLGGLSHQAARGLVLVEGVGLLSDATEPLRLLEDTAPKEQAHPLVVARAALVSAELALAQGRTTAAKDALETLLADEPTLRGTTTLVHALIALAEAHLVLASPERAETRATQAIAAAKVRTGDVRTFARASLAMARVEVARGHGSDAADRLTVLRKGLVAWLHAYDPLIADIDVQVGAAREAEGKLAEARTAYLHGLGVLTSIRTDHPLAAFVEAKLALLSVREGTDGLKEATAALAHAEEAFGKTRPILIPVLRAVAAAKARNKDGQGAVDALERAIEIVEKHHGYVAPLLGDLEEDLGLVLTTFGTAKEALKAHDDALLPLEGMYGMTHPKVTTNLVRRGDLAHRLGDAAYAKQMWGAALPDLEARLGPADPTVLRLHKSLGK